jgi:hypothetical protein
MLMCNAPIKATTADTATSTANAAAAITYAAAPGFQHGVHALVVSYAGGTASGSVKIEDAAGTVVFFADIPAAGIYSIPFPAPLVGTKGAAMVVTLAAGGSGVVGKLNIQHAVY